MALNHCFKLECYAVKDAPEARAKCKQEHFIVDAIIKYIEKAYGNCRKCFGKGYSTVMRGTRMIDDSGEEWETKPSTKIIICDCKRGKEFEQIRTCLYFEAILPY